MKFAGMSLPRADGLTANANVGRMIYGIFKKKKKITIFGGGPKGTSELRSKFLLCGHP